MKSKLLKKIRKNYEIVKRDETIDIKDDKLGRTIFEMSEKYKFIISDENLKNKEKKKEIKKYWKTFKESKKLEITTYIIGKKSGKEYAEFYRGVECNGLFFPIYNYNGTNYRNEIKEYSDIHFKFNFIFLIWVCLYKKYCTVSYSFIEGKSDKTIEEKVRLHFQRDKVIKKKNLKEKTFYGSFKKVWYNK